MIASARKGSSESSLGLIQENQLDVSEEEGDTYNPTIISYMFLRLAPTSPARIDSRPGMRPGLRTILILKRQRRKILRH